MLKTEAAMVAAAAQPATAKPPAPGNTDTLAAGKLIFEKTAGGVGCASCHGLDGKGGKSGAPDIRGASEAKVRTAVTGGVLAMSFIKLGDSDITAVAAYLKYLNQ
ncbi:MAG: cytochrome c [Chloroflexi bacterium]|nr:cytochrome c [Chloroflexota bacterium]